jgi:hypothetical protein
MKHYYAKLLATTTMVMASSLTSQASGSLDEPGSWRTFVSMNRSSAARTEIDYYRDGAIAVFRDISEQFRTEREYIRTGIDDLRADPDFRNICDHARALYRRNIGIHLRPIRAYFNAGMAHARAEMADVIARIAAFRAGWR